MVDIGMCKTCISGVICFWDFETAAGWRRSCLYNLYYRFTVYGSYKCPESNLNMVFKYASKHPGLQEVGF